MVQTEKPEVWYIKWKRMRSMRKRMKTCVEIKLSQSCGMPIVQKKDIVRWPVTMVAQCTQSQKCCQTLIQTAHSEVKCLHQPPWLRLKKWKKKQDDNSWQTFTYISRGLTDTKNHYAEIEKETPAVMWACERLTAYVQGLHFTLQTDHKPLGSLLIPRGLNDLWDFNWGARQTPHCCQFIVQSFTEWSSIHWWPTAWKMLLVTSLPATDARLTEIKQIQQMDDTCKATARYSGSLLAIWMPKHFMCPSD